MCNVCGISSTPVRILRSSNRAGRVFLCWLCRSFLYSGTVFAANRKTSMENNLFYTKENYPDVMNNLPEEVRKRAISNANKMFADGDIRLHRKIITALAIQQARKQVESTS